MNQPTGVENDRLGGGAYWQAVLDRDPRQDGVFVYAVRSTGVYCRPSCPSRRPARQHVEFYAEPQAAERAGFRPCRRCRPAESRFTGQRAEWVRRACALIDAGLDSLEGAPTLSALAQRLGVSVYRLARDFNVVLGITPRQYADAQKLERLKTHLRKGDNVTGALYEAGYGSARALYERAPRQLGMTPATYRRGGEGMSIGYAVVNCSLGRLLVAATNRGVCRVCLGDSDQPLVRALEDEYPKAEVHPDAEGLRNWVGKFLDHIDGTLQQLDLPLDVRGTAFQWRAWQALRAIPYGTTRSYSEVARRMGNPKATRAVARACATNPVAIVVPCHRVIREDGSLGGYGWGLERKKKLLAHERANK